MAGKRLTQKRVDALQPQRRPFTARDTHLKGFGVRVTVAGAKRYVVQSQHKGRRVWTDIGDAQTIDLAEARKRAVQAIAAVRRGDAVVAVDPETTRFETVAAEVFRRYRRHWKPRTLTVNLAYYKKQILPFFRGRQIAEIGQRDVQHWFAALHATPVAADRSAPVLSVIMSQAEAYGYRPEGSNPCVGIRRYRRRHRERFLSPAEMRRLAAALHQRRHDAPREVAIIRLLLLTGCRKGEILALRWRDYREGKLYLPDSKTGPRTVWLSSPARAVLEEQPRRGRWVFPAKSKRGPLPRIDPFWFDLREAAGLGDVRLHDLRHTYASVAMMTGETVLTVGRLLGHTDPGTTLKYAHAAADDVQAAAETVGTALDSER